MPSLTPGFIHRNDIDGIRHTWDVRLLWELAAGLPVREVSVAELPGVDENGWFHAGEAPTVRNVVAHLKRILAADIERPIILNVDGTVMDGLHRVARALLDGRTTVPAVRFEHMPPSQAAEPAPDAGERAPEGPGTNPSRRSRRGSRTAGRRPDARSG